MIEISLSDPNLIDNIKAIRTLRESGMYSEEEIQKLYNEQIEADQNVRFDQTV